MFVFQFSGRFGVRVACWAFFVMKRYRGLAFNHDQPLDTFDVWGGHSECTVPWRPGFISYILVTWGSVFFAFEVGNFRFDETLFGSNAARSVCGLQTQVAAWTKKTTYNLPPCVMEIQIICSQIVCSQIILPIVCSQIILPTLGWSGLLVSQIIVPSCVVIIGCEAASRSRF